MENTQTLYQQKYQRLFPELTERSRRLLVAADARMLGYGGITLVSRASGLSRHTIHDGIKELDDEPSIDGRVRRQGAGRKTATAIMPQLEAAIEAEASPKTDRRVIVKWTSNSVAHITEAIASRGFIISCMTTYNILKAKGYALKANKKDIEGGKDHPDRDAQFRHINMMGLKMQLQGFPVLSIDAKKTEKIGNMKNGGREWLAPGEETKVNVYDFGQKDPQKKNRIMKAIPYGIYDILKKQGFMNVGIDHNTAEFAVASLLGWWNTRGKQDYPEATELLLFSDCGSSNGSNNRLWKYCLQQFANTTGLIIHVCHYPPGTSKWNAIEHEMFSFININWRAKPLVAYEVVLEYIRNTTTKSGLKIEAVLDTNEYEIGKKVTNEQLQSIRLTRDEFHGEWNYTISPGEL